MKKKEENIKLPDSGITSILIITALAVAYAMFFGKRKGEEPTEADLRDNTNIIPLLEERLEQAVREERYEDAVKYRDKIASLLKA